MKTENKIGRLSAEILELERRGEYDLAFGKLEGLWDNRLFKPRLAGLDVESESELILRCGAVVGFHGNANQIEGSQECAKNLLTEARRRFQKVQDFSKIAECENYLALTYHRTGEFAEAISWCDEALSHSLDELDFVRLYSIVAKSLILVTSGKYEETLEFCWRYEAQVVQNNDSFILGCFNTNFGLALKNLGRTIEALDKLGQARNYFVEAGHRTYLATVENNLAQVNRSEGRFALAHTAADDSIKIYSDLGEMTRKGSSLDTKAQIFLEEGKYKEALKAAEDALEILKDGENTAYLTEAYFTKAKILVFLDDVATATLSLMKAVELARTNVGENAAEKLAKEFEIVLRKKSLPNNLLSHMPNKIFEGELELILPPSLANYDDYQVVRIKNSHLEEIGIEKDSLAVVVSETIKRGDLIALTEIANDSIICGFYDYFAGIVSISRINAETHLFKSEEVKVVGKIIGVGNSQPGPDGKIYVKPIEI